MAALFSFFTFLVLPTYVCIEPLSVGFNLTVVFFIGYSGFPTMKWLHTRKYLHQEIEDSVYRIVPLLSCMMPHCVNSYTGPVGREMRRGRSTYLIT